MNSNTIIAIVVIVVIILILLWIMIMYNGLVKLRQYVQESWSDVDTELKRRHDLIPNLVQVVRGYAAHEKMVFEQVTRHRQLAANANPSISAQASHENALSGSLGRLFAVAEQYPALKADQNFLALQKELANTEDRIQAARRFYNANVRDLNTRIETVPSSLIASWFHFHQVEFFELKAPAGRAAPHVAMHAD